MDKFASPIALNLEAIGLLFIIFFLFFYFVPRRTYKIASDFYHDYWLLGQRIRNCQNLPELRYLEDSVNDFFEEYRKKIKKAEDKAGELYALIENRRLELKTQAHA